MLENLSTLPPDPILDLARTFKADNRAEKIDLGLGVYMNERGETAILECVKQAEQQVLARQRTKTYIGIAGDTLFNQKMCDLALGALGLGDRVCGVQTPGGSGALRLLFELAQRASATTKIWLPTPGWANHTGIADQVGLPWHTYPYFDIASGSITFEQLHQTLKQATADDIVVLHGCCHNPTGADLTLAQWGMIGELASERGFIPLIDLAYQGFGHGLNEDVAGLRLLASRVPELLLAVSCSKNFALYRERIGCAIAIASTPQQSRTTLTNMLELARVNHSMPPAHGAEIVRTILCDERLRRRWIDELEGLRQRLAGLRQKLASEFSKPTFSQAFDAVGGGHGLFSMLPLTTDQINYLRRDKAIYMLGNGRINIAGLRNDNIDRFVQAVWEATDVGGSD